MALDPSFIAALTAGAKASTAQQNAAMAEWEKNTFGGGGGGGAWNLGQGIIDILSTGGYASAGATYKLGQNVAALQRGELGAALDLINPISGIDSAIKGIAERRTYSQNLEAMGMDKNVSPWVGLALDIGLDPLTYVTGGTIAGVRGIAQGAKAAGKIAEGSQRLMRASELPPDALKLIDAFPEQVVDMGRPLTQDERIANLLTGMSRGWTGARRARNVSIRAKNLQRVTAREARRLEEVRDEVTIGGALATDRAATAAALDVVAQSPKVQKAADKYAEAQRAAGIKPARMDAIGAAGRNGAKLLSVIGPIRAAYFGLSQTPADKIDATLIRSVADGADFTPESLVAYDSALAQAREQYRYLIDEKNLQVKIVKKDPYTKVGKDGKVTFNQAALATDVQNGIIRIQQGTEELLLNESPQLLAAADKADRAVKRANEALIKLQDQQSELDAFARTIPTGQEYIIGGRPAGAIRTTKEKPSSLNELLDQLDQRLAEFRASELPALATSAAKLEKLTAQDLFKILQKDPADRTDFEWILVEELRNVEVDISDLAALGDFAAMQRADLTRGTTLEQRQAWAREINSDKTLQGILKKNNDLYEAAKARVVELEKEIPALEKALSDARTKNLTAKTIANRNAALTAKLDEIEAAKKQVTDLEVNGAPPVAGYTDFTMVDMPVPKFGPEDYFIFSNRRKDVTETTDEALKFRRGVKPKERPESDFDKWAKKNPAKYKKYKALGDEIRSIRQGRVGRDLTSAEKARIEELSAQQRAIRPPTDLGVGPRVEGNTMGPAGATGTLAGARIGGVGREGIDRLTPGRAETISLGELARIAAAPKMAGRSPAIKAEADLAFSRKLDELAEEARTGPQELKPWIDGFINGKAANEVAIALIRYVAPELEEATPAFNAAREIIEQALEGVAKKITPNGEEALDPNDLAELIEEFLSGRDLEKAFDAAKGVIDMGAATGARYHTDLDSLLQGINAGTTKLTPIKLAQLSRLLGLPSSSLDAAKRLLATHVDSISRAQVRRTNAIEAQSKAQAQLQRFALTGQSVDIAHALEAAGDANGPVVGPQVEEVIDLQGQTDNVIRQTIDESAQDLPSSYVTFDPSATAQIDQMRIAALADFNNAIDQLLSLAGDRKKTREILIQDIINLVTGRDVEFKGGFANDQLNFIRQIANDRKQDPEKLLAEILSNGTRALSSDETAKLSRKSIVFNQAGSESRYGLYKFSYKKVLRRAGEPEELIAYEAATNLAVESLLRILAIPVRTTENLAMKLRRSGIANVADEIPGEIVPHISNVTFADIMGLIVRTGNADLGVQLRKVRGAKGDGLGNFLPSSIEGAWLVFKAAIAAGQPIAKGSPAWDEAMLALSTQYKAVKEATNDYPVDKLFVDAPQVIAARRLKGKDAEEIAQASENYLQFLADNSAELMRLDQSRAVIQAAIDSGPVYELVSNAYKALLSYTLGIAKLSKTAREVLQTPGKFEEDYNAILTNFDGVLDTLRTGDIADPEAAEGLADVIGAVFSQGVMGVMNDTKGAMLTIKERLISDLKRVREMRAAMYGSETAARADVRPGVSARRRTGTITPKQETAGRKARTRSIDEDIASDTAKTQAAIENADRIPDPEITPAVVNASDLSTTTKPGPTTEFADGQAAAAEQVMVDRLQRTGALTGEGLQRMLNGDHGMGKLGKTIINGMEHSNISSVINYGYGLRSIKRMFRGREDELRQAFIALQKYGAAEKSALETNTALPELIEYLNAEKIPFGSEEALRYMQAAVDALFGSGGKLGIIARTGIFARELNKAAGKMGLLKGGETGKGLVVSNDASPEALDYFWTNARIDEMEDMDPLLFLHKAAAAIHNASAHIEIAHLFNFHFGKTAAEIARDGDNIADFVRVDPKSDFGRLMSSVETDRLFHRQEIEKMKYIVTYLNEDKTFSESSLRSILEISDRITYFLKSTNTLWRLGHHVVSIIGETAMNTLAGVRPIAYQHTIRILAENRPGIYMSKENPFGAYIEMNAAKGMKVKPGALDNVYWITPDGKKQVIPDEILMQLADRYGALVKPGSSLEDLLVEDRSLARGFFARFDRVNDKLAVAASYRDNFFRLSHFIDELQKTRGAANLEEAALMAATAVREWHPTVGGLSAWEKKYARRLVYFYTWQRLALTKIIMTAIEKPGIMTIPSKIQYAVADFNGYNPESFGDPWDPNGTYASWYTGSLYGPQFSGPRGQGDAWGVQLAVQPIDIFAQVSKPFTIQPGEAPLNGIASGFGELASSNLNPVIKTLIESASQSRLGEGGDLPNPVQYTLAQIGVISTLAKTTGFGQDANPYQTEQDRTENNARLWTNLLLGQRLTDYQTPASTYKWEQDQYQMMRRMAGLE